MADVAELAIRARTQGVRRSEKEVGRLQTASTGASKAVRVLGTAIAALGVGAAARTIRANIQQTAQISELGDVAGVSAERIQELSKAFSDMAGITESVTQGALRRFNRRLGLAEDGGGAAGSTFDKLGIAIKDVNGEMRSTGPVLNETIARLADIENEARRSARASEVFGEDAGPRIAAALAQGGDALDEQIRQLREHGRILTNETVEGAREANDELSRMGDILSTEMTRRIAANSETIMDLANALFSVAEGAMDALSGVTSFTEWLAEELAATIHGIADDDIVRLEQKAHSLRETLERFEQSRFVPVQDVREAEEELAELEERIAAYYERQEESARGATDAAQENAAATAEVAAEAAEAALSVQTLNAEFLSLEQTLEDNLFRIASEGVESIRDQVRPGRAELREFREQVDLLNLAVDQNVISTEQATRLQRQLNDQLSDQATEVRTLTSEYDALAAAVDRAAQRQKGFGDATEQGTQVVTESQEQALRSTTQMFGNMAEIAKAGGEDQFETYKRLAQAQAALAGSLAVIHALATPAPWPIPAALATTAGALAAVQIAQIDSQEYQGRKTGGQVRAGQSYVVGEEGPEVVTMNSGGHVTPNHQLAKGGGDNNVTQVFQLSDNARREARQQIFESAPMIRNMAKQAVIEAAQQGGSMSRAFGRRN